MANELIAAIKTGSNDDFTFVGAVAADATTTYSSSGSIIDSVTDAVNKAAAAATGAAGNVLNQASKSAAQAAQNVLTPIEIALAVVVGLVVLVIFTSGKAGGVSAGPTGVDIGGSR